MNFLNAIQYNDTLTENFMPTHSTSGSYLVDLFYRLGASRQDSEDEILNYFIKAFYSGDVDDALNAIKTLFYARDIRQGQGERRFFRIILKWLAENHPKVVERNLESIPFYGRWDDVLVIIESECGEETKKKVADYILFALKNKDGLCAKWMPRENKKNKEVAKFLYKTWGIPASEYRKLLSGNTKVVENLMCKNQWNEIKYETVPSVAMHKYRNAFARQDADRFSQFIGQVIRGEEKINSSALYPYQIIDKLVDFYFRIPKSVKDFAQAQWDNLPNYVKEGESFIPVVDTSGSMMGQPILVAVSLGIYLSERNVGPFKDAFITFSNKPELQILKGSLFDRVSQLLTAHWDSNTNLESVFKLILVQATSAKLLQNDMPKNILILSDMQFDQCIHRADYNVMQMVSEMYRYYDYEIPKIVFWNLRNSYGVPTKHNATGTLLVSGFSPSIMKSVLEAETPLDIVLKTINSARYNRIVF